MKKFKLSILSIIVLFICMFSTNTQYVYAQQQPPIKDVCIYPIYTSQTFNIAWDYNDLEEWIYELSAVHYITGEVIPLLSTPDKTAELKINKSGLWEIRVLATNSTTPPYASTLNEDTCSIDGVPQKWVIYTSPEPPGPPIIE